MKKILLLISMFLLLAAGLSAQTVYRNYLPGLTYTDIHDQYWLGCTGPEDGDDTVTESLITNIPGAILGPSIYVLPSSGYMPVTVSFTAPLTTGNYYYQITNSAGGNETTNVIVTDTPTILYHPPFNFTLAVDSHYTALQIQPFSHPDTLTGNCFIDTPQWNYNLSIFPNTNMITATRVNFTVALNQTILDTLQAFSDTPGTYTFYIQELNDGGNPNNIKENITFVDLKADSIAVGLCAGSSFKVPYTTSGGNFASGNTFTAQLSDANGSFASPLNIGSINALSSDTIAGSIPDSIVITDGYRIRVISSNPAITGKDTIGFNVNSPPVITNISTTSASAACSGSGATITINSSLLATGTYTVTYNLSGANAVNSNTATMYFTVGSPGSGTFTTSALANTGATTLTISYLTFPLPNGCSTAISTGNTATFTVNPSPGINPVSGQTLCSGSAIIPITFSGNNNQAAYKWTNGNSSIGLAASGSGNIGAFDAVNSSSIPDTATIIVTPSFTNDGATCSGTPANFTIIVNPNPATGNFSTPSALLFCPGAGATVTVNSDSLATGAYSITYNLNGANTDTGKTATMNFTAGSTGSGSFITSNLSDTGSTSLTITSITNLISGCSSIINNGNTADITLSNLPAPTIEAENTFIQTFTTSGSFTPDFTGTLQVLVVAGGGAGASDRGPGNGSAGGGAGGLIYDDGYPCRSGMPVFFTVGPGGTGVSSGIGNPGGNSVFGTLIALGGAAGDAGGAGGSGGGTSQGGNPGSGTPGQGNAGGTASEAICGGSGGGGAGIAGGSTSAPTLNGANGGNGIEYSISGTPAYYAGGGGGALASGGITNGIGGLGGGGNGTEGSQLSRNAATNTGGGGGGCLDNGSTDNFGGNGGSGIVIVSYPLPQPDYICLGQTTQLVAFSFGNTINWWTAATGGTVLGTSASGARFDVTPSVTTTYYAEAQGPVNGCISSTRAPVTITVSDSGQTVTNFSILSATTPCSGNSSTVTVNSTSLTSGAYLVTYDISGANTATGNTATMNFTAGSPGSGTFTTSPLANTGADTITISSIIFPSAGCNSNITSGNTVAITVNASVGPSVNIAANPTGPICPGTNVIFTSTPVNGGIAPAYQWLKNANVVGGNSAEYSDNSLINGDTIICKLTSNLACASPAKVLSEPIVVMVDSLPFAPAISKVGDTLHSSPAASYQWYLNDSAISGAVQQQLVVTRNGTYQVQITDNSGCINISNSFDVTGLGLAVITGGYGVQLYPNPSNGLFILEFSDAQTRLVSVADVTGRLIMPTQKASQRTAFDLGNAPGGVYLLQIKDKDEVKTLRIVVAK